MSVPSCEVARVVDFSSLKDFRGFVEFDWGIRPFDFWVDLIKDSSFAEGDAERSTSESSSESIRRLVLLFADVPVFFAVVDACSSPDISSPNPLDPSYSSSDSD